MGRSCEAWYKAPFSKWICNVARGKSKRPGAKPIPSGKSKMRQRSTGGLAAQAKARPREIHPLPSAEIGQSQKPAPPFRSPESGVDILYGFHPVREALRAGRRKLLDLYATEQAARKLADDIGRAHLRPKIVEAEDLGRRLGAGTVHQGILLEALPLAARGLSDIVRNSGIVLVLDQITDPHNIGAILRTAAAFGVDAVVLTERHAPELAGVAAKAASGGIEHVPIIRVVNLARALDRLGESGYLRLGLDSEAELSFAKVPLKTPLALVLGAEDKGLRRLTREKCDVLVRLDLPGAIKSLNVSNACAVALTLLNMALAR